MQKSRPVRNVSGELSLVFSFNKHERRLRTINFIQGDSSEIMLKAEAHVVFFFWCSWSLQRRIELVLFDRSKKYAHWQNASAECTPIQTIIE
jgi:hypothetical protein